MCSRLACHSKLSTGSLLYTLIWSNGELHIAEQTTFQLQPGKCFFRNAKLQQFKSSLRMVLNQFLQGIAILNPRPMQLRLAVNLTWWMTSLMLRDRNKTSPLVLQPYEELQLNLNWIVTWDIGIIKQIHKSLTQSNGKWDRTHQSFTRLHQKCTY